MENMRSFAASEAEYDFPLELKFDIGRGFFLRMSASEIEENPLDPIFVNVVERKKMLEFTTLELMKRNAKVGCPVY